MTVTDEPITQLELSRLETAIEAAERDRLETVAVDARTARKLLDSHTEGGAAADLRSADEQINELRDTIEDLRRDLSNARRTAEQASKLKAALKEVMA